MTEYVSWFVACDLTYDSCFVMFDLWIIHAFCCDSWFVACDSWSSLTYGLWLVVRDSWYLTCDMWWMPRNVKLTTGSHMKLLQGDTQLNTCLSPLLESFWTELWACSMNASKVIRSCLINSSPTTCRAGVVRLAYLWQLVQRARSFFRTHVARLYWRTSGWEQWGQAAIRHSGWIQNTRTRVKCCPTFVMLLQ